jgi:transposase
VRAPALDGAALDGVFLPVEIDALPMESAVPAPPHNAAGNPCSVVTAQRVDIILSDGRRILVEGPTALSSVLGLVQGLMA